MSHHIELSSVLESEFILPIYKVLDSKALKLLTVISYFLVSFLSAQTSNNSFIALKS